ncbi:MULTISPECIES: aldose 1-epimerase family protein [unclassified Rhizobium]|uniref:aldose 1-epimerase family protein n=1 Tax=unclassified Rhizobium TaxID=2613769 RepID=UPI001ADA4401|nr:MULTISPECIES: aldose 1-epimerase family protein [unclassified Rhizobium]MBO9126641.1 aldose 1-epimerase family protein [Rhizobium sp. 16-488-2b]MBO9177088.1 aldose 1-epimerase family protein [Rhizobium sp. 16-488-2a]
MVELFGQTLTQRQLAERAGSLSQVAGVRLMTLSDGVERGVRMLDFRTGSGLRFTVLVDRAMDIGDCDYRGLGIAWNSPTGFRNPALHEYEGEGGLSWARSFSGLLVTCGLDHILGPEEVSAEHFNYPGKRSIRHSLHGRIGNIPARLVGYGESWVDNRCVLWAEGVVQQAAVFGENLHLVRRIEADVGGNEIRVTDRVVNQGFMPTPHMLFYHVNVSYPLLDAGAQYLAPIDDVVWASHAGTDFRKQDAGYRTAVAPRAAFREQVWQHSMTADEAGRVSVAVVNDRLKLGLEIETVKEQLPCAYVWQNFQAGQYALGIEPSTNHVLGENFAREREEIIWLSHGDERPYSLTFRIIDGRSALDDAVRRIASVVTAPDEEFPEPSNVFPKLARRTNALSSA